MNIKENVKTKLKEYRKSYHMTQNQVARELHIHRSTYTYYELGTSFPPIENLVKIADMYHLTLDELIGRTPPKDGFIPDEERI